MASHSVFQFLLLISLLMIINSSPSFVFGEAVTVSVYYQSIRPHTNNLPFPLFNSLRTLFDSDIMEIVNLRLVSYGNAVTTGNATVNCPDGPTQCFYNTIEACAFEVWNVKTSFPFVSCAETSLPPHEKIRIWRSCLMQMKVDPAPIEHCYKTGYGNLLLIRNGRETKLINPPHDKLPWIIVNGRHIPDTRKIVSEVCKVYNGNRHFAACKPKVGTTLDAKLISSSIVSS